MLYIILPPLILLIILTSLDLLLSGDSLEIVGTWFVVVIQLSLGLMLIMIIMNMIVAMVVKDYKFHLTKACMKVTIQKPDKNEIDTTNYIILGLNSYP
jgi:hypothetical protein